MTSIPLALAFPHNKSIKANNKLERAGGEIGRNVYIANMKQKMPQNADQCSFLRNNRNKTELISTMFPYPIIITEEEKT